MTKLPKTLVKLHLELRELKGYINIIPFSAIAKITQLQELNLSLISLLGNKFEGFEKLQHVSFSQLQILNFEYAGPRNDLLIKFLENNGKYLKEFMLDLLQIIC